MFNQNGEVRVLVFRLGTEHFALALAAVDEVLELTPLQHVPDAPPAVLGVATIRDELVMMYDARTVLEIDGELGETVLLFRRDGRRLGLVIGDVEESFVALEREVRPAPGGESSNGVLVGVILRDRELVALLDAAALVSATTFTPEAQRI